jgi:hypothetical protein
LGGIGVNLLLPPLLYTIYVTLWVSDLYAITVPPPINY